MRARSKSEASFLRGVSQGLIEEFRNEIFKDVYITSNPAKFLNTDWINIEDLKAFITAQNALSSSPSSTGNTTHCLAKSMRDNHTNSTRRASIKREDTMPPPQIPIKLEPTTGHFVSHTLSTLKTRTVVLDNGKEAIEILSDSDSEIEFGETTRIPKDDTGASSDTVVVDSLGSDSEDEFNFNSDSDMGENMTHRQASQTVWLDPGLKSTVSNTPHKLNRQLKVERVEYLNDIPSYWPVPRVKTAYIVNLSDPKFNIYDENNKLIPVDALIKNKDQDSWTGTSGARDSTPSFDIFTGTPIPTRRSRLECAGIHACEHVEPSLLGVERYELDPKSLETVIGVQVQSRMTEADTPEKQAAIFLAVLYSTPCSGERPDGTPCDGYPIMKPNRKSVPGEPTRYFIACENWTSKWREHRSTSIPDSVDVHLLSQLFAGKRIRGFATALNCGRIVPAHIGGKIKQCRYPHFSDGTLSKMVKHTCNAGRTIFVPLDPKIRMACVVPNHERPHNHPILPATKASYDIKNLYVDVIQAAGVIGSSVRTVDNARSTQLLLEGKSPALIAPALQNMRLKQDLLRSEKKKQFKYGNGISGVSDLLEKDLVKPLEERYVHSITSTSSGGLLVFTCQPYLLKLIHTAYTIEVDTTFQRTDEMKEWELVIWCREVQRAVTAARIYSNRADTVQYHKIFDEVQRLIIDITGKPLLLKRLSKGGTLLSIGVDLELAQVLGAGKSFLPTNEPEYSGITTSDPEVIVTYFVRACYTHAKRGVHDLKPYVTDEQYRRLMNFVYLESEDQIKEFSDWIKDLEIPKVTNWWKHKTSSPWILPALIKCRSNMDPDDWVLTQASTNIGEAQHHWTNINTGVNLSLLEAILTARELDEKTAAEIKDALSSGVLKNNRNDAHTRLSRSVARKSNGKRKQEEAQERDEASEQRRLEAEEIKQNQKENRDRLKALSELNKAQGSSRKRQKMTTASKAESSSSGRVEQTPARANSKFKPALTSSTVMNQKTMSTPVSEPWSIEETGFDWAAETAAWVPLSTEGLDPLPPAPAPSLFEIADANLKSAGEFSIESDMIPFDLTLFDNFLAATEHYENFRGQIYE